jgi:hypothetical protein
MVPFNENRFHYAWHWHRGFGTGDMGNDGAHQLISHDGRCRRASPGASAVRAPGITQRHQTPDTMNMSFDFDGGSTRTLGNAHWHDYGLEGIDNGVLSTAPTALDVRTLEPALGLPAFR